MAYKQEIFYGSTSTKKLRPVNISFDTPTDGNSDEDDHSLVITSIASDACSTGKGGGRGGSLGKRHCRPPGALARGLPQPPLPLAIVTRSCPPPPLPHGCCLRPPHHQFPRPSLLGRMLPSFPSKMDVPGFTLPGHICCGPTRIANRGSDSELAILHSAPTHRHCNCCCPGWGDAWGMSPPRQACAGWWITR